MQYSTTPFYMRDLSISDFGICGRSWNQFPADTQGQLYRSCLEPHSNKTFLRKSGKFKLGEYMKQDWQNVNNYWSRVVEIHYSFLL